jgi:hypothetical protein
MSSFGFLNVSGIDGVGNGSGGGGGFPGGIDKSVQFNDGGLAFGGVSTFLYDKTSSTMTVNKAKPGQIIDRNNSVGTAGQVLSSTGTQLEYVTPTTVSPGAPSNSVQFNNAGAFGGDSNFIFNPTTDVLNINGNVGIGSLANPTDRLVVTGANSTIKVKSTTFNNAYLVLEDGSANVKQLTLQVNTDTADFTSIQQGVAFKNFRFNPTNTGSCIGIGTTGAQAVGGIMCSNSLSNRKIILNSTANDEHQNISLGVNEPSTGIRSMRFQLAATNNFYTWNAATASNASNELMRLTGIGQMQIGTGGASNLTISKGTLNNAAPNTPATGTYLKIGGPEFRTGSYRLIGFGYNTGSNNQPAYMGYYENTQTGDSNGSLVFGTRNTTTLDVVPTERMRISPNGNVSIGNTNSSFPLEVTGTIRSTSSRPNTILDTSNAAGTAGQLLSSTGTAIQWVNPPTPVSPAGSTNYVQYNNGGVFGASVLFQFDPTINELQVSQVNTSLLTPTNIRDVNLSTGSAGQLLSSTGTAIEWINPPTGSVPGGANTNIQFNSAGTFGGSNNFTYTDTTSHLKVQGLLTVGNLFTTVPRIFAQSGSALFAISSWDDQWILAGGGSGASNSAGIGIGYNNTISSGILACSEPSTGYKPIIYSAASHDFKTNGSTRMTVTQTGGGDGLLTVPILQATTIRDGSSSVGTAGQFLSSTGTGLSWASPAPFADSISNVGPFLTTVPTSSSTPTMAFVVPRAGRYRITTNVVAYPTGPDRVVTVETYWRQGGIVPYNLAFTSTSFMNGTNIHLAFPSKSGYVTLAAGSVQILIRTGANTGSGNVDPVNVDLLECTV